MEIDLSSYLSANTLAPSATAIQYALCEPENRS
jgi:hypothetical protein